MFDKDRQEKARTHSQARKEAIDAARAASHDKSRDEVRALLERELSERGLTREPLMMERLVEMILAEREPLGKTRFVLRALKQAKDSQAFGGGGILDHASGTSEEPWEPRESPTGSSRPIEPPTLFGARPEVGSRRT